jgi:glutathione S-transferase
MTMKLFYSPGACSLSPHIVLCESGLPFDLERVDLKTHRTHTGADYWKVNPKGYVPALALGSGELLTEGPAIIQYIGDLVPDKLLVPANGTLARYQLQAWLNFIATELHKQFGPLFHGAKGEQAATIRGKIGSRLMLIADHLNNRPFLMGESFSVADAYLFVMTLWCARSGVDIDRMLYPNLNEHFERTRDRPAVRAALASEDLLDKARAA